MELTEAYLGKFYDDIQREQQFFMSKLKQLQTKDKEKEYHRRISILQTILINILKYKTMKPTEEN